MKRLVIAGKIKPREIMGLQVVHVNINGKDLDMTIGAETYADVDRAELAQIKNNAIDLAAEIVYYEGKTAWN